MQELWKPLPWFKIPWTTMDLIHISNLGRVKTFRFKEPSIMRDYANTNWYRYFQFTIDNKRHTFTTHKAVTLCFLGERTEWLEVNHIDGNKGNNKLDNLEYVTHHENMQHAIANGLKVGIKGEAHYLYGKTWAKHHLSQPITQYTVWGVKIKHWESMWDIQRELWFKKPHISKCIKEKKPAYNFIWEKTC
jgi:hypothetical protein